MAGNGGPTSGVARRVGDGAPLVLSPRSTGERLGLLAAILSSSRWVGRWQARARDRRLLASFDDRMLRDIGLDRASLDTESTGSFWRRR